MIHPLKWSIRELVEAHIGDSLPSGCRVWTGAMRNGRPILYRKGKKVDVRRWLWRKAGETILPEQRLRLDFRCKHSAGNRCIEVAHFRCMDSSRRPTHADYNAAYRVAHRYCRVCGAVVKLEPYARAKRWTIDAPFRHRTGQVRKRVKRRTLYKAGACWQAGLCWEHMPSDPFTLATLVQTKLAGSKQRRASRLDPLETADRLDAPIPSMRVFHTKRNGGKNGMRKRTV